MNNNNQQTIVPLQQPLVGKAALFKQLELLGRNATDRPHAVIKFNNKIIYGSKLVEKSALSGEKYLDLEVLELQNPKTYNSETKKEERLYHSSPNDSCKVFKFADPSRIQTNGFEFLESRAKKGDDK